MHSFKGPSKQARRTGTFASSITESPPPVPVTSRARVLSSLGSSRSIEPPASSFCSDIGLLPDALVVCHCAPKPGQRSRYRCRCGYGYRCIYARPVADEKAHLKTNKIAEYVKFICQSFDINRASSLPDRPQLAAQCGSLAGLHHQPPSGKAGSQQTSSAWRLRS